MSDVQVEMPRYQSHKKVWALQIIEAIRIPGGVQLSFKDRRYAGRVISEDVVSRYFPQPGDYLVQYEDGYLSISPQKAFEEGYSPI